MDGSFDNFSAFFYKFYSRISFSELFENYLAMYSFSRWVDFLLYLPEEACM